MEHNLQQDSKGQNLSPAYLTLLSGNTTVRS